MQTGSWLLVVLIPLVVRAEPVDYEREVRPIFERHCYECHGANKQKSGLRLDVRSAALRGGDSQEAAIVPGRAGESALVRWVGAADADERMPPKGPLSAAEIATLTRWIDEGARWPEGRERERERVEDGSDHWSFRPVTVRPGLHSIDAFVEAKLEEQGLRFSPAAERRAWLRRVTFDLVGLPPTLEETEAFAGDGRPDAYERVVERLLASGRYGERWGQHWLDVVRYADTHGFEVNTERPNAWPYRDYVIRALNEDTPYDRFIREQIVGDALGEDAATGFLVTASVLLPGQIGKDAASVRLARQDSLDEIVNNISQTFLGLSVGCARCHDHKFDPISSRDYYAMQAFVAGVEYEDRELHTAEAEARRQQLSALRRRLAAIDVRLSELAPLARPGQPPAMARAVGESGSSGSALRPTVRPRGNTDRFHPVKARRVRFVVEATNSLEPCLDELEVFDTAGVNVALASLGTTVTTSGDTVVPDRHEARFVNDGCFGNSRSWMSNQAGGGWVRLDFGQEREIGRVVWSRDREGLFEDRLPTEYRIEVELGNGDWVRVADASDRRPFVAGTDTGPAFTTAGLGPRDAEEAQRLLEEKRAIEGRMRSAENGLMAFAGKFRPPDTIHLLRRGDPEQPGPEVAPAVLRVLGRVELAGGTAEQARRRALAEWIASPRHPLTARVMVNRLWQGHFGAGLVPTPSDFGRSGLQPSHPELLDWLADEFVRSGWSLKHMHRLMVLSRTYRQSSLVYAAGARRDPEVRWLWRYPARRLEAETIRDSMLAVSGRLNLSMYGRGYDLFDQRGGLSGFKPVEILTPENQRRMIYAHKVRRESEAVFGAFDCPDAGQSTALRRVSTTPIQALNLFNSRFSLEQAAAFAGRVRGEVGADPVRQIERAYLSALSRRPTTAEGVEAEEVVRRHGLEPLCRALFNCNEFLFVP